MLPIQFKDSDNLLSKLVSYLDDSHNHHSRVSEHIEPDRRSRHTRGRRVFLGLAQRGAPRCHWPRVEFAGHGLDNRIQGGPARPRFREFWAQANGGSRRGRDPHSPNGRGEPQFRWRWISTAGLVCFGIGGRRRRHPCRRAWDDVRWLVVKIEDLQESRVPMGVLRQLQKPLPGMVCDERVRQQDEGEALPPEIERGAVGR